MKIDIAEVPKIRDLLDSFLLHSHQLAAVESSSAENFRAGEDGGAVVYEISKEELTTVMQARIDKTLKTLNSKYYIEFKQLDPLPLPMKRVSDIEGVEGEPVV